MVDYYGLPQTGNDAWPGRPEAGRLTFPKKGSCVQDALLKDLVADLDDLRRFVPFVMMHEFEGLLFSDCSALSSVLGRPELRKQFEEIRAKFATPEEINDSPQNAPSKRIIALVPDYQKPLLGVLAVLGIGLERIREECPHFDAWLSHLEALA